MNTSEGYAFAGRCFRQATTYDPQNYRLWREQGRLALYLKDYAGAREAFRRVRALRDWVSLPPVPETSP